MTLLRSFLVWLFFPLAPAFLASAYSQMRFVTNDPRDWDLLLWLWALGPLLGFGFLAGASLGVPDPDVTPSTTWRQHVLRPFVRRSVWIAVGPWLGFLAWVALYFLIDLLGKIIASLFQNPPSLGLLSGDGWPSAVFWYGIFLPTYAWTWLIFAVLLLRRAHKIRRFGRSLWQGVVTAVLFAGSLFGTFWAVTETWRTYFFDTRLPTLLIASASVLFLSGCGTPSLGDLRRQHLFLALLQAWVIALAFAWRWLSRPRPW